MGMAGHGRWWAAWLLGSARRVLAWMRDITSGQLAEVLGWFNKGLQVGLCPTVHAQPSLTRCILETAECGR